MNKELNLLYIGSLDKQSNSYRRFVTLSGLCAADALDTDPYIFMKFFAGVQYHYNIGPGIYLLNKKVRHIVRLKKYDVIFIDNKPYVNTKTLRFIRKVLPSVRIADLLTDDPFGRYGKSWGLIKKTASLYDRFFVQRKINIKELKALGAKNVDLCYRSFDPEYNKPVLLKGDDIKKYSCAVGFVGTYEDSRASHIACLIENSIPVSVTGNDWPGGQYWNIIRPFYKGPSTYGDEYIKILSGMEIALHFLRHGNRDEQDSRTFEIPACGTFMLAEKSEAHLQLFEDNKEAVFFTTKEELLQKVKYYLANAEERKTIAANGYKKCYTAGYSHEERMKKVLKKIIE